MATKKDKEKQMEAANAAALKAEELSKAGGIPMDGRSLTGAPESTIGMSKNERFFSQGRALDQQQREGYKTFGDKATGEGINKLRALQGRPAISNTPKEFSDNINKSVGFGGKSALLDQAGRDRALKGGIGAGLSYEEADAAVSKAYDFLKKKYGDKTTPTTPTTLDGSGNDPRVNVSPPKDAPPLTLPPVVQVEKGPIGQFFDNVLSGGSPERDLVKGWSMYMEEKARLEKARLAKASKVADAAGDAAKPFNMIDDAAKVAAEALKQKYDIPKIADDVPVKSFNMVDDAAKVAARAAEATKVFNAALDDAVIAAEKTGLDAYNAALRAGLSKEAAVAAGDAAESKAIRAAYQNAADSVGKPFDAVDEAAGAADEAAGATDKAAGATDKAAGATDKAVGATDEAAAAAGKGGGLFSKLSEGLAKSQLGRGALTTARGAGKGLRFFGRAAGPVLDIIDAAQYFGGNPITGKSKDEVRADFQSSYETLGQRFFTPKSVGEFGDAFFDAASLAKAGLGAKESVSQMLKSQREARGAEASFKHAQNVIKAQHDRRKELYPDEEFDKLPIETRRKIMQAVRKEFKDAGVQTYGRFQ